METAINFMLNGSVIRENAARDVALPAARQLYEEMSRAAWRSRLVCTLRGRPFQLAALSPSSAGRSMFNRHDKGLQTVPINHIVGSEDRSGDFDLEFHPLRQCNRERWLSIAKARLLGVALPPVELIQIGGDYFVRDGHHRISVARALGEEFIEARVTVWMGMPTLSGEKLKKGNEEVDGRKFTRPYRGRSGASAPEFKGALGQSI